MEYSAIFHDMDKRFSYAVDKDLFVIRVQVKKDDMKEVILHYEDKYIPMERKDTRKTVPMKKVAVSQFHDYYEAQIKMHLICLRYFFEFTDTQGEKVYYGNYEFDKECITNRDRMFDCPQNLREEEMFEVPEWPSLTLVWIWITSALMKLLLRIPCLSWRRSMTCWTQRTLPLCQIS